MMDSANSQWGHLSGSLGSLGNSLTLVRSNELSQSDELAVLLDNFEATIPQADPMIVPWDSCTPSFQQPQLQPQPQPQKQYQFQSVYQPSAQPQPQSQSQFNQNQPHGSNSALKTSFPKHESGPRLGTELPKIEPIGKPEPRFSMPVLGGVATPVMQITLYHKPRGSHGTWLAIQSNDRIRVTKGKGKKLRVEVRCNFAFQWKELYVTLVDMISGVDAHQDFSIDTKKSKIEESDHVYVALIEVNLVKICKKLCFRVNLTSRFGWTCEGRSVPFTTHNNGKDKAQNGPTTPEGECIPSSPYPSSHPSPSSTPPRTPDELGDTALRSAATGKKRRIDSPSEQSAGATDSEEITVLPGPLHVHGPVRAPAFIQFSDLRLKTDIADLVGAMELVSKLQGKTYKWKKLDLSTNAAEKEAQNQEAAEQDDLLEQGEFAGRNVFGLIAQEVQRVVPEAVYEDPVTGYLSVAYGELIPVIIEALKEHLAIYQQDKQQIQTQLQDLRASIKKLHEANTHSKRTSGLQGETVVLPGLGAGEEEDAQLLERVRSPGSSLIASDARALMEWMNRYQDRLLSLTSSSSKSAPKPKKLSKKSKKTKKRMPASRALRRIEKEIMLDPIKLHKSVLRYQCKAYYEATKRNAKIAVVLFWEKHHYIKDLTLHVQKKNVHMFEIKGSNRSQQWVMVGVVGTGGVDAYNGIYKTTVELDGYAHHLSQSKAVVAMFDFRMPGVQPLFISSAAVSGSTGHTWIVGSFLTERSVSQWLKMPNMIVSELPEYWLADEETGELTVSLESLSLSDNSPSATHTPETTSTAYHPPRRIVKRMFLRSSGGKYLSADVDGNIRCINAPSDGPGLSETWELEFDGGEGGYVTLMSCGGGYLGVEADRRFAIVRPKGDGWGWDASMRWRFRYLLDESAHQIILICPFPHLNSPPCYVHPAPNTYATLSASPVLTHHEEGAAAGKDKIEPHVQPKPKHKPSSLSPVVDKKPAKNVSELFAPMGSSLEFYKMISEGVKNILPKDTAPESQTQLASSSDTAFYSIMSAGAKQVMKDIHDQTPECTTSSTQQSQGLQASLEFYQYISNYPPPALQQDQQDTDDDDDDSSEEPEDSDDDDDERGNSSDEEEEEEDDDDDECEEKPQSISGSVRMPREEEKWIMEPATLRQPQNPLQQQEVWQKLKEDVVTMMKKKDSSGSTRA